LFHHCQAQIHKEAQKLELTKDAHGKAAEAHRTYLKRLPHSPDLYELTYYLAECLYDSLRFEDAATRYVEVRDSSAGDQYLEEAAFSVILSLENMIKVAEGGGELP
jgi:TolA-binding protein